MEEPLEPAKGRFPIEVVEEVKGMEPDAMSCGKRPRLVTLHCWTGRYLKSGDPYRDYGVGYIFKL